MNWDIVVAWLVANVLPLVVSAVVGALLYGLVWAQGKAVKEIREYADNLTPAQHDAIERFINLAQEKFAQITGAERMAMVLLWMEDNGIPINRSYVQVVYNFCKRQWDAPKEAA